MFHFNITEWYQQRLRSLVVRAPVNELAVIEDYSTKLNKNYDFVTSSYVD